jgi:hypothetical protein
MFQLASAHPCAVQGHHLHSLQCSVAVSVHSFVHQLKKVTSYSFFFLGAFKCSNFSEVILK